jgi:hypothetical protein
VINIIMGFRDMGCYRNHICLSRGVYVTSATWRVATRIYVEVEDMLQRTEDGQSQAGYSVVGVSGGREVGWRRVWSAPCTRRWGARVSWLSLKIKIDIFSGLSLKIDSCGLVIWDSKSLRWFSWVGPQNQAGFGLSVAPQNQREEDGTGRTCRFHSLAWLSLCVDFTR